MASFKIQGPCRINGRISLPGDKSIAHRFVILSCLSRGLTVLKNFPFNDDCISTIRAFKSLGARIIYCPKENSVKIRGNGLRGLKKPSAAIFVKESGTTLRLLLGVLSGQNFRTRLTCARSLSQRPMLRVTAPLRKMGAQIIAAVKPLASNRSPLTAKEEYPPLTIQGKDLKAISYRMPVASAQVKSAILLAGLYGRGITEVFEPIKTRDHTERLLKAFRAKIKIQANRVSVQGGEDLVSPGAVTVPGDISSAAFFLVLAAITDGSQLLLKNVSLNPSRLGIIRALKRMGADIKVTSRKTQVAKFEPMGDIEVKSSRLKGAVIRKSEIPSLIDELPVLMVAACFAQGQSRFQAVGELRFKETDRIKSMLDNLTKMGAAIKLEGGSDIVIKGKAGLKGAKVKSFHDHRTAMSLIVAGSASLGTTIIDDIDCINKSFPDFLKVLKSIAKYH
jgi:3-phosphoshikimate 1-carboxyvinyltransferase